MSNLDIAFRIAAECEEFIEDPEAYDAYLLAVEYDETFNLEALEKAVKIYNNLTGAGLKLAMPA